MTADNKPVLEAAQQARDAIAGEPATMKIVGESSINPNSGGAPAPGGQALAGGNVQVLMGELGPEMYVSNGQYFIAGQNGPEMVSLPSDAIVFNHLQTDDLLKKESTFGTGHPITNERNAVAMASGTDPQLLGLITGDGNVNLNIDTNIEQAQTTIESFRAQVEEGAAFPISPEISGDFESVVQEIQQIADTGLAPDYNKIKELSQRLTESTKQVKTTLSESEERLSSGITGTKNQIHGAITARTNQLASASKAAKAATEDETAPLYSAIKTKKKEIDQLREEKLREDDIYSGNSAIRERTIEKSKSFADTEGIAALSKRRDALIAERDTRIAQELAPLTKKENEFKALKSTFNEKEDYYNAHSHEMGFFEKRKYHEELYGKNGLGGLRKKVNDEGASLGQFRREFGAEAKRESIQREYGTQIKEIN